MPTHGKRRHKPKNKPHQPNLASLDASFVTQSKSQKKR